MLFQDSSARCSVPECSGGEPVGLELPAEMQTRGLTSCFKEIHTHGAETPTLRHLCLTDLAHAGWDIHEIATFAGHRSVQTTLLYIHLSGRDLSLKLAAGMAQIHARRVQMLAEVAQ
jgi:Phage integrase family